MFRYSTGSGSGSGNAILDVTHHEYFECRLTVLYIWCFLYVDKMIASLFNNGYFSDLIINTTSHNKQIYDNFYLI